jgi:hypothetical protein
VAPEPVAEESATWVEIVAPVRAVVAAPAEQPGVDAVAEPAYQASAAEVTVLPDVVDQAPVSADTTIVTRQETGATTSMTSYMPAYQDAVTLLEIAPPETGGIQEAALPGNRAGSPPAPLPARRIGWNHPVARWTAYVLVVVALTFVFLWLLVDLFHVG